MLLIRLILQALLFSVSATALAQPTRLQTRASLAVGEHHAIINGVRLWYRAAGRRSGIPVVYLHGGPGQGSQSFAKFAGPYLERDQRMVYLDQRGAGRSERPWNGAYSIDLLVEDLELLRRAWRVPRIAIIGHSFGSILAMEYGAKYPGHVSHIVLAASVPDIQGAFDVQCARLERLDPAAYARAVSSQPAGRAARCNMSGAYEGAQREAMMASYMFPNPATARQVNEADAENGLKNTGVVGNALFSQGLLTYRFSKAADLRAPVLVLTGSRDGQAVPEPQRAFVQALRDGRMIEYSGAGHFLWAEQPKRFARDVSSFLKSRPDRVGK
jgi:proline iminopeptidase